MKKAGSVVLTVLLISIFAYSQAHKGQGRVNGVVTDEQGNPLEGVTIKLYLEKVQSGFETETDKEGEWKAWWIRGGTWKIDFEKPGYMPHKLDAVVNEWKKNPPIRVTMKKVEGAVLTEELVKALNEGNELFDQMKYQEAMSSYQKILQEFPDAYIINKNIGNCYFQLEQYEKAEEHYKKVLEKDPDDQEIMMLIGNTYTNRGENGKASEWYQKIDFEKISDPTVLYNIGSNFYSNQKYEDALKYYKRAVEIKPDFLDALYQLGLVHLTLSNYQDSIQVFEKYLEKDPDSERSVQVRNFIEFLRTKIKE
jgi:tetratricopeptide (TPR) repeat protein